MIRWKAKPQMKMRVITLLAIFTFCLPFALIASTKTLDKAALIGTWDYTSYTAVHKGKPSGAVQFKPGTMQFIYREDGTWEMHAADATRTELHGTYEVRAAELIMKKSDGSLYQDFDVELKNNGKDMVLKDKNSIVIAKKIETSP